MIDLLRHTVATLAYRGAKTLRDAPEGFANFRTAESSRTPGEILAHLGDLFDWAFTLAEGAQQWNNSPVLDWEAGSQRFFVALARFDARLAAETPLACTPQRLFQGPIADALTHVGQLAMLRRMAGAPIRGENYFKADIETGKIGSQQHKSRVEFD